MLNDNARVSIAHTEEQKQPASNEQSIDVKSNEGKYLLTYFFSISSTFVFGIKSASSAIIKHSDIQNL